MADPKYSWEQDAEQARSQNEKNQKSKENAAKEEQHRKDAAAKKQRQLEMQIEMQKNLENQERTREQKKRRSRQLIDSFQQLGPDLTDTQLLRVIAEQSVVIQQNTRRISSNVNTIATIIVVCFVLTILANFLSP